MTPLSHFATMGATRKQLQTQYARAKSKAWTEHFREAANTVTAGYFDTADLMAIGSRETNLDPIWLTKPGDGGHGFGLMQADLRSFPDWIRTGKWKDSRESILKGAEILMQKWHDLQTNAGKRLTVKSSSGKIYSFVGPHVAGIAAQQVAIAAYNSGRWAAYHYSKGNSPDQGTTGKDYSADVMTRARIFRELLAKDGMLDAQSSTAADDRSNEQAGASVTAAPTDAPPSNIPPPVPEPVELEAISAQPTDTVDGTISKWSSRYAAIPAAVFTFLGGVWSFATSGPVEITVTLIITGGAITGIYFLARMIIKSREDSRKDKLQEQREARAHEIMMATLRAAADPSMNTVKIVNPPSVALPNSDSPQEADQ